MIAPLRISFDVECPSEHAFTVWTTRIDAWWPRDHTVTGNADLVVLEPGLGGRIFERTLDGTEHEWGEVTSWDPPRELAYRWHLGADPATATEVAIRFRPEGDARTTRSRSSIAGGSVWAMRRPSGVPGTRPAGTRCCRISRPQLAKGER